MKNQRHKRKESFSVLLVSNTDRSSRQFNISLSLLRAAIFLLLFVCVLAGVTTWLFLSERGKQAGLAKQAAGQAEQIEQLKAEKDTWDSEKQALLAEARALRQEIEQTAKENAKEEDAKPVHDPTMPDRYPVYGACVTKSAYSEDQPYLALTTYAGGSVTAAGDGTVVTVSSDDTYSHIVEIDHPSGYRTRYLCRKDADVSVENGAAVSAGDTLLKITTDETQLDYQVIYEGGPLDPFSIIDARG